MADFNTVHQTLRSMPVPNAAQRTKLIKAIDTRPSKPQPDINQRIARASQPKSANAILSKQVAYGG